MPVEDADPLCPDDVELEDGLLELLLLEDDELDEELEDDDELDDEELLLEDSCGALWLVEVWQALNNKLSVNRPAAAIVLLSKSALLFIVFISIIFFMALACGYFFFQCSQVRKRVF